MNWIAYIKKDENAALKEIYLQYRDMSLALINKEWDFGIQDQKEIFQLAVVILYDQVVSGRLAVLNGNIQSYLNGIIKNKCRELYRKQSRTEPMSVSHLINGYVSSGKSDKKAFEEKVDLAHTSIQVLGDPCRSLLQLYYYKQLPMDDIAQLMGYKNRDTVKNQKYKCMKRLQKIYFNQQKEQRVYGG